MNEPIKSWWRTRTLREQRLLLAMFGLAALVLAWLVVIRPMSDALSNAKARHNDAVLALAEVKAEADAIRSAQQAAPSNFSAPVDTILGQSANEAGFTVTRVDREGPSQATLIIAAVRAQAFFGWVAQMESRGLIVDRLAATTNSDQTLSVQATFRARGG